ncbi:MAG TPA: glutamine amidotransferase [Alcaligenes sp.]|nr:glutamine amidotransferase [Alcaligenes sp.]HRL26042.1 glutamine amidotransferase [Alcaligenes sp.]
MNQVHILQAGDPPADIQAQFGTQGDWFTQALQPLPVTTHIWQVDKHPDLPPPDCPEPVIITGSWGMVTDRPDWSEALAGWIRQRHQTQAPLLGICYGHQLMAQALGGQVDYHPQGRELGCLPVCVHPQTSQDPLLAGLPFRFKALLTHQQSVLRVPEGVQVLAGSAHDPHQILRFGPAQWSAQFHPEFFTDLLRYCIIRNAQQLQAEGHQPQTLAQNVQDTPQARRLLWNFVGHVLNLPVGPSTATIQA